MCPEGFPREWRACLGAFLLLGERCLTAEVADKAPQDEEGRVLPGGVALRLLIGDFVVAGFATGAAIVQAVIAEADVELSLTEDAVLLALATILNLLALAAADFGLGGHRKTVAPGRAWGNVPLVTWNLALGIRLWALAMDSEVPRA